MKGIGFKRQAKPRSWWDRIILWPRELVHYWSGKRGGWRLSARLRRTARPLLMPEKTALSQLAEEWQRSVNGADGLTRAMNAEEEALLTDIRQRTEQANRNNVTRTAAYLAFYRRHPEVHWALLAHMVSRNGGWNMTDLQGDLISRLLSDEQRRQTFLMLERANFLIFGDAYPQLLLYEAGLATGKDLSRLLPLLGVSRFMLPVWGHFYREREPALLTIALIVNEQHYIEERIVRQLWYREHVLDAFFFSLQSPLQMNQVIFPFGGSDRKLTLVGLVLEDFNNIRERIEFGKRLYAILFRIPEVCSGVYRFACHQPHTGSRADYAAELFSREPEYRTRGPYEERLHSLRLLEGAGKLYSPEVGSAWADQPIHSPEPGDWLANANSSELMRYLEQLPLPKSFAITNEYGFALDKLELAVLASQNADVTPSRRG